MSKAPLKSNPTLRDLQDYVAEIVVERGFENDHIAQRFMLLLEESGEFARAARKHAGLKFAADTHNADIHEEAADIFIILLGICNMLNIDLEQAFRDKEEKNKTRTWA